MIEQLMIEIKEQDNVRAQLSALRQECKSSAEQRMLCCQDAMLSRYHVLLSHEDSKTRKNVALLLGDLSEEITAIHRDEEVAEWLFSAYEKEATQFVLGSYIHALANYDCQMYLDTLKEQLRQMMDQSIEADNLKHVRELRKEIEMLLSKHDVMDMAQFQGMSKKHTVLLVAEPYIQGALTKHLEKHHFTQVKTTPRGLRVTTDTLDEIKQIPLYRELLFVIRQRTGTVLDLEHMAQGIVESECIPMLREFFSPEGPFTFRLSVKGKDAEGENKKIKEICYQIEEASSHVLRNVTNHYMVEIQCFPKKDGTYALYAKFPAIKDERFSYRKKLLPTSMSPVTAAQMVELITPYLREGAQIIDPFCGTGSLLIERCKKLSARHVYGVDTYGDAIQMARENTTSAKMEFYYINRDYFDFTSEHLLDEVITEFPRMENKSRIEVDDFYQKFFWQTSKITVDEAMLFLLSTEENSIKKQLRVNKDFQLVRQIPMRGSENIFIIKKRG